MEELTSTELAVRLHKSERTIQRWIQAGKLAATLLPDGRYAVDSDAIDAIVAPIIPLAKTDEMLHRLDDIEHKLDTLTESLKRVEAKLAAFPLQPSDIPTTAKQPLSASQEPQERASSLPEGAILLFQFARNHGLPDGTIKTQARAGRFAYSERQKPNRPTEHDKFLTREQQRGVIAFWKRNGTPFVECPSCPHE